MHRPGRARWPRPGPACSTPRGPPCVWSLGGIGRPPQTAGVLDRPRGPVGDTRRVAAAVAVAPALSTRPLATRGALASPRFSAPHPHLFATAHDVFLLLPSADCVPSAPPPCGSVSLSCPLLPPCVSLAAPPFPPPHLPPSHVRGRPFFHIYSLDSACGLPSASRGFYDGRCSFRRPCR